MRCGVCLHGYLRVVTRHFKQTVRLFVYVIVTVEYGNITLTMYGAFFGTQCILVLRQVFVTVSYV